MCKFPFYVPSLVSCACCRKTSMLPLPLCRRLAGDNNLRLIHITTSTHILKNIINIILVNLVFLPAQKEYQNTLKSNKRYKRIHGHLKNKTMIMQITFLIEAAPMFNEFL